jgi:hypothetical protein
MSGIPRAVRQLADSLHGRRADSRVIPLVDPILHVSRHDMDETHRIELEAAVDPSGGGGRTDAEIERAESCRADIVRRTGQLSVRRHVVNDAAARHDEAISALLDPLEVACAPRAPLLDLPQAAKIGRALRQRFGTARQNGRYGYFD